MTRAGLQCAQMLCALGLGLSLGIIYDIYRIFIKKNHGKVWCWLGDFFWWLIALTWSFFLLLKISWAELRIPIVAAVFIGIVVYLYYFSPVLAELYRKFAAFLVRFVKRLYHILVRLLGIIFSPLVFITGLVYKIIAWFCRRFLGICHGVGVLGGKARRSGRSKAQQHKQHKKLKKQNKAEQKAQKRAAKEQARANRKSADSQTDGENETKQQKQIKKKKAKKAKKAQR